MEKEVKLFMVLLGCRPKGRLTEQHDVFFGIGTGLADLLGQMNAFWPDSNGLHIDAWREVTQVDGYQISVEEKTTAGKNENKNLFFINLGGYKENVFEEYHYKILSVSADLAGATKQSKRTAFFKHADLNVPGGAAHIDDKYGIDVDDAVKVKDILPKALAEKYAIRITETTRKEDDLHIGYLKLSRIK